MSGWKDPEISALEVACDRFTQDNAILRKENTHLLSKIEQLRGDIVLTATEHDKTIDETAALRAEVDSLKQHIERLVTEKDNCAKNWYDCRADLAAAVEVLRELYQYSEDDAPESKSISPRQRARHLADAFLARMEVKP